MAQFSIYLNDISSLSALGSNYDQVWKSLSSTGSILREKLLKDRGLVVSALDDSQDIEIKSLKAELKLYSHIDRTTLMAILVGRQLKLNIDLNRCGINIGSSRGATQTFEDSHKSFLAEGEVPVTTSPTTTLGNIASNVAQDLGLQGPAISHSITCSSALHALLNGFAFLRSGMLDHFIIGGAEAPLTDFTIAQMQALKLYSQRTDEFPCRSLDLDKSQNTLVLGEAACLATISTQPDSEAIEVCGIGYATEQITHSVSLSADAKCLQQSMKMALESAQLKEVDVVVMHAPGTVKGDVSEYKAITKTFNKLPALTTNKFLIGHTFGASGAMSLEMAVMMIRNNEFIPNPFYKNEKLPKHINTVMVNAVGFGGNAVSVILKNYKF
jgi:3-oxoacyl-(acyl-carrier-protein) synthase